MDLHKVKARRGRMHNAETVPCGMCGTPTTMTGTERCDRCWELERRVQSDPDLAWQVLRRPELSLQIWEIIVGELSLEERDRLREALAAAAGS